MKTQDISFYQLQNLKEDQNAIKAAKQYLSKNFISDEILAVLCQYSESLYNRNLKIFNDESSNYMNFVTEAVLIGFDDIEYGKKLIRNRIINYKRVLMAKVQASNNYQFNISSKICRKCQGDPKPVSDFSIRTDKNTGFKYYNNICKQCERNRCKEKRIRLKLTVQ